MKENETLVKTILFIPNFHHQVSMKKWTWEERMVWEEEERIVVGKGKEERSQNSQPTHGSKSPGPHAIKLVLCNRKRARVVSAICDGWQRHTCGWQSHPTNHKCHQSLSTTPHISLVMHAPSYIWNLWAQTNTWVHLEQWNASRLNHSFFIILTKIIHMSSPYPTTWSLLTPLLTTISYGD